MSYMKTMRTTICLLSLALLALGGRSAISGTVRGSAVLQAPAKHLRAAAETAAILAECTEAAVKPAERNLSGNGDLIPWADSAPACSGSGVRQAAHRPPAAAIPTTHRNFCRRAPPEAGNPT